jgi:hypothetical protein
VSFITRFPVLTAGVIQSALALGVALGLHLTPVQTGAIEAAAAAVLAVIAALRVRPFEVSVLGGVLVAIGTVLVAFRVPHVTPGLVSIAYALFSALIAGFVHSQVSPVPARVARH